MKKHGRKKRFPRQELTTLEIAVLVSVVRMRHEAYGLSLHHDLQEFLMRPISRSAVYVILVRLERRMKLHSTIAAPVDMPGGRSKRVYSLTDDGRRELDHEMRTADRIWYALPWHARRAYREALSRTRPKPAVKAPEREIGKRPDMA